MAPQITEKKKRVNKRKVRTEASVSSSSESERSSSPAPSHGEEEEPVAATVAKPEVTNDTEPAPKKRTVNSDEAFSDFYLRQTTKEFANDLDKLRATNDFNARSVPVLIEALKQGGSCFSKDEVAKIGRAAAGSV